MDMTSPTKALGPEPAYCTVALNMQLPKICYSQAYFLKSKENFKAETAVIPTLNVRCSKQAFILQAHRPLIFKYM